MKIITRRTSLLAGASLALALCLGYAVPAYAGSGTVTVQLLKSDNSTGIAGGIVEYYKSGWQALGTTDGSGKASGVVDLGSGSSTDFHVLWYGGIKTWSGVDVTTTPTLTANTTPVTLKLQTCAGADLAGKAQWYAGSAWGSWVAFGNTPATTELLPGTYSFAVSYSAYNGANASFANSKSQDISANPVVVFNTTKVTLNGPNIMYYENSPTSGWVPFISPSEMLPGTVSSFNFNGVPMTLNISGCTFAKTILTIKVLKSNGQGQPGASVVWWEYGKPNNGPGITDANGTYLAVMDGIIGNTAGMGVGVAPTFEDAAGPQKFQNPQVNSVYTFQLTSVTVKLVDNTGAIIGSATPAVTYSPWGKSARAFGTMVAGCVKKDLMLGGSGFSYAIANFNNSTASIVTGGNTSTVNFQTGKVLDDGFGCQKYQAWFTALPTTTFTDGIQLLDHGNVFGFSKTGTTKTLRVHPGQTLDINTGLYTTP